MAQDLTRETKQATVSLRRVGTTSHCGKTKSLTSNLPFSPSLLLREPLLPYHFPYVPSPLLPSLGYLYSLPESHTAWQDLSYPSQHNIFGTVLTQATTSNFLCANCLHSPLLLSFLLLILHQNTFRPLSPLTII